MKLTRKGCIVLETIVFAIGIVAVVIALMTRRYTIGGIVGLASFIFYFSLVENGSWITLFLFSFGVLLIIMEVFIPDYGVMGVIGIIMLVAGTTIMNASVSEAIVDITVGLLIGISTFLALFKLGYRLPFTKQFVLENTLNSERGYNSAAENYQYYLNQTGITATPLRPTGKATFENGQTLDVVSDNDIINANESIRVVAISGNKLTVRRTEDG